MSEEEKTYILEMEDGTRKKVTVPASWKVTFGPAFVSKITDRPLELKYKVPMAIRFYESADKQRAIFTGIVSFRDSSIKIEEEIVKVQEKDGYLECEGTRKRTTFQAKTKEWVNPDTDQNQPLLPTDSEMFDVEITN